MEIDQGDFLLTEAEFSAALNSPGVNTNDLGIRTLPQAARKGRETAGDPYRELDAELRTSLKRAIDTLAAPAKIARFHYTVADRTISRCLLAWSPDMEDTIVTAVKTGESRRVGTWSQSDIISLISRVLAANDTLREENISLALSTRAIVVLLAITEHLRLLHYYSVMRHSEPLQIFNKAEVEARLADAANEDFRWPLLFLEKVMPVSVPRALSPDDVERAIDELLTAGLVENADGEGKIAVYELTGMALRISDELLHDVSKVALGISTFREDGQIGHEVMLLVRSSFNLFLFDLAGQDGAVVSLSADELDALMKHSLAQPSLSPPVSSVRSVKERANAAQTRRSAAPASANCPSCGAELVGESLFCDKCGNPVRGSSPAQCAKCEAELAEGAKFCKKCGTPVKKRAG